jgi:hypothetical protein
LINVSISEATGPKCILKKYKHNKWMWKESGTPCKKPRRKIRIHTNDFNMCVT